MTYYRRRTPELWEEIAAAAAGAAAGLAGYYLARTLLRRERLPRSAGASRTDEGDGRPPARSERDRPGSASR